VTRRTLLRGGWVLPMTPGARRYQAATEQTSRQLDA